MHKKNQINKIDKNCMYKKWNLYLKSDDPHWVPWTIKLANDPESQSLIQGRYDVEKARILRVDFEWILN